MSLFICGLPSVGKSTFGRNLSEQIACPFIDLDHALIQGCPSHMTVRDLYLRLGEKAFREREYEVLEEISRIPPLVVALGGGTFENPDNCELARSRGKIIFLRQDPKEIWKRIKDEDRAFLDSEHPQASFYALAHRREQTFQDLADYIVDKEDGE